MKLSEYMTREEIKDSIQRTAFHEAGHAVAMHLMMGGVGSVNVYGVDADPNGECTAEGMRGIALLMRREKEESEVPTVATLEGFWDKCVCTACGNAAEALFGFHGDGWCDRDISEAEDSEDESEDMNKIFKIFIGYLHFIEHRPEGRRLKRFSPHRKHFKGKFIAEAAVQDAIAFLKDRTCHVEAIAERLIERFSEEEQYGVVWGHELEEIIGSPPDEMIDVATAAECLGISRRELCRRIEGGEIRAVCYGEIKRVFASAL